MNQVYDAQYFIDKFEAIPEELWNDDGNYQKLENLECRCAYGHLGETNAGDELFDRNITRGLTRLFAETDHSVISINDGLDPDYPQPTPKQRVLAALKDIKDREK